MASNEQSGFEQAISTFDSLIAVTPVDKQSLLGTLATVKTIGEAEVRSDDHDLGNTRYSNVMAVAYGKAIALSESGAVRPPLAEREIRKLYDQRDILSAITDGNSEAGPTDTSNLDTTDRK